MTIQIARINTQEKPGMRIHLRGYGVDAFRAHFLRAKGNDSCSRLIVMWVLFLPKGIYNRFILDRSRLIVTRRVFFEEEGHNLVGSPALRDKNIIHMMLRELPVCVHEVMAQLDT